jgi:hypothetical protein
MLLNEMQHSEYNNVITNRWGTRGITQTSYEQGLHLDSAVIQAYGMVHSTCMHEYHSACRDDKKSYSSDSGLRPDRRAPVCL